MHRHSKQREAILGQLAAHCDHPTAETLYAELKESMPSLSLATVYRNLKQLEDWGDVVSVVTDGARRYDYNTEPHSHFFCRECGAVIDYMTGAEEILEIGRRNFAGIVETCSSNFYGICPDCKMHRDGSH